MMLVILQILYSKGKDILIELTSSKVLILPMTSQSRLVVGSVNRNVEPKISNATRVAMGMGIPIGFPYGWEWEFILAYGNSHMWGSYGKAGFG